MTARSQHGRGMAVTCAPVRQRRHWAVGAAWPRRAWHVAPGKWERGGGATHERSTAPGPAGQSRPRRAVQRRMGGMRGACVATSCMSARALALGVPAQFHLGLFNCKYL
jgi:hypothetical protein